MMVNRSIPWGDHVLTTCGIKRRPDSSAKTRWTPSRAAFFLCVASASVSSARWPPHFSPGRAGRASVSSSQAVHQPSHMIPMVLNSELAVDQFRNARRRPQIRPVPMPHRAFEQKLDQALSLPAIQLPGSTWRRAHPQPFGATLPSGVTPAHHRARITADAPSHFVERITRIQQCQGSLTPIFEQVGAPLQSGHRCSAPEHLLLHYLCRDHLGLEAYQETHISPPRTEPRDDRRFQGAPTVSHTPNIRTVTGFKPYCSTNGAPAPSRLL